MPAAPPPGFHHAHIRFDDADWEELHAFARRSRLPIALAVRMLVLRGLTPAADGLAAGEGQP